ncbi:MAG: hypothetical protein AB1529_07370 [Candidatus Micrarchaeota archaeon]
MAPKLERRPEEEQASGTEKAAAPPAHVEDFCKKYGLSRSNFVSNLGMVRSGRWMQGVDWKKCAGLGKFNSFVSSLPFLRKK